MRKFDGLAVWKAAKIFRRVRWLSSSPWSPPPSQRWKRCRKRTERGTGKDSGASDPLRRRYPRHQDLGVKSQEVVHPGRLCDVGGCESTITAEKEARMDILKNARTTPHS
jgi:hypothetical protein